MDDENKLSKYVDRAKVLYTAKSELYCPYFGSKIALTSDGFNHLQYKQNRSPRNISEQILKLSLLKNALTIIPKIGTLQEYRSSIEKIGEKQRNGFYNTVRVQYWGFHAILKGDKQKIKIILKQIGDRNIMFWSVMPFDRRLYSDGVEDM